MLEPGKVDFITSGPDGDVALLYIVQENPWTGAEDELRALQEKIYNYVDYALDGQMAADFPDLAGLPWRVVIDSRAGEPDSRTGQLLELLTQAVTANGGELRAA